GQDDGTVCSETGPKAICCGETCCLPEQDCTGDGCAFPTVDDCFEVPDGRPCAVDEVVGTCCSGACCQETCFSDDNGTSCVAFACTEENFGTSCVVNEGLGRCCGADLCCEGEEAPCCPGQCCEPGTFCVDGACFSCVGQDDGVICAQPNGLCLDEECVSVN